MVESVLLSIVFNYFSAHAHDWLKSLGETILGKGKDLAKQQWNNTLNEKQQQRHIELALKNAAARGLTSFQTLQERDQYRYVLKILAEPGSHSEALRRELLQLFTLYDIPDLNALNEAYNRSLRIRSLTLPIPPAEVDASPYLKIFFEALFAELYQDIFFRPQMSNILRDRAAHHLQTILPDILTTLHLISEAFSDEYPTEQFEREVAIYTSHIERRCRLIKLAGVVPQNIEHGYQEPELEGIFVPLRVVLQRSEMNAQDDQNDILTMLQTFSCIVLLGGPGSGKSTITRYLAWSHANKHLPHDVSKKVDVPILAGHPIPLRIELRLLAETRRSHQEYDFLAYVTNVLLGGAGVHVDRRLFERLLEQRGMLVLFDGLDEVATIEERRRLIEDIESFIQDYPGNPVVVTSRPVGYELAPCSERWFKHTQVLPLNDKQIDEFLERWYTHVLRISPLLPGDRQEMETLVKALHGNDRLHILAQTPLLLSVIVALHRYERLPDRRVMVYDRCVELLLGKWAQLKGVNGRLQNLRIPPEYLRACVAHIGFILHQRSQENMHPQDSDVPLRELLKVVFEYLQLQHFFISRSEERIQASCFLELVREEAGLIVERGTDEQGESLYGFIHQAFQEYLAAVDVYERYLESEDPSIIRQFLIDHLHDPHWQETILLLLAKLKRGPVSTHLSAILDGTLYSQRSSYTDLFQHDLFFLYSCLIEGVIVEITVAERIIYHICDEVKASPFLSQRIEAILALNSLLKTTQYNPLVYTALEPLTRKEVFADTLMRGIILLTLYLKNANSLEEMHNIEQKLFTLTQEPDLPIKRIIELISTYYWTQPEIRRNGDENIYESDPMVKLFSTAYAFDVPETVNVRNLAVQMLLVLTRRTDLSIDELLECANNLWSISPPNSENRELVAQILLSLTQQINLLTEGVVEVNGVLYKDNLEDLEKQMQGRQILLDLPMNDKLIAGIAKVAHIFYEMSPHDSSEQKRVKQVLFDLTDRIYLSHTQFAEAVRMFYDDSSCNSQERELTRQMLTHVLRQCRFLKDLLGTIMNICRSKDPGTEKLALQMLSNMAKWIDLDLDAFMVALINLLRSSDPQVQEPTKQLLLSLIQQTSFPNDIITHFGNLRKQNSPIWQEIKIPVFLSAIQRNDLSIKDFVDFAHQLYKESTSGSEESEQAKLILLDVAQRNNLSIEELISIETILHQAGLILSDELLQTKALLPKLTQQLSLTIEQIVDGMFTLLYQSHRWEYSDITYQILFDLSQDESLSIDQRFRIAIGFTALQRPEGWNIACQMLSTLLQIGGLSVEQSFQAAYTLYVYGDPSPAILQWTRQVLSSLSKQKDLPIDQLIKVSIKLCRFKDTSEQKEVGKQMLLSLIQRADLSVDQFFIVAHILYEHFSDNSEERKLVIQQLQNLMQSSEARSIQQLQAIEAVLTWPQMPYVIEAQAIHIIRTVFSTKQAEQYLREHWKYHHQLKLSDLPSLVELVQLELLSPEQRDTLYQSLRPMISQLNNL